MASAQNPAKISNEMQVTNYLHDPADATVATKIAWVDMRDYEKFAAIVTCVQPAIVTFKLFVSGSSTGADTPVLVREHATPTTADAAGDSLFLECTGEELAALASATCVHPRYVSAEVDMDTNTDTAVVTYIRSGGKRASGLTGDVIS